MKAARRVAALSLALFAWTVDAHAQGAPNLPATIEPLVEQKAVAPGDTARVAIRVTLADGLHAQSNKPRDPTLIPSTVTVDPPEDVTVPEIVFPKSIDIAPLPGFAEPLAVFEHTYVIGGQVRIGEKVNPGTLTIPVHYRYQACNDSACFPPRVVSTTWTISVQAKADATAAGPAEVFREIAFGTGEPPASGSAPAAASSSVAAGDDVMALLDRFEVTGSDGGYKNTEEFLEFIRNAEAGITPRGMFEGQGPAAILAIVFVGGLALNLTPCVLPMIPINLAIIGAGARNKRRGRGFVLGAVYGGAMALVYGVLGLIVILTAGTFGTLNASPWFNVGIAALFVVLGLAMFDVIPIDLSRFSSRIQFRPESRGTFMLAFSMGAIAALLAGACVAPVVIQVVVFASDLYASGTTIALALPFVLGLGMALPWPIAGAGMASLPKPGAWMVRVKYAMGVFILGTAAYYGYIAYGIFANRWVDPASVAAGVEEKLKDGWHASLADGLRIADRDRTPVLIDFWATWCKNCLVMDATTLADPAVTAALAGYTKIKFQAEDPESPPAKPVLDRLPRVVGLPHYAILKARP